MSDGPSDTDRSKKVLSEDDLDFTRDRRVHELSDDRFVISTGGSTPRAELPEPAADTSDAGVEMGSDDASGDGEFVTEWLAESFADNGFEYGFDLTVDVEGEVNRHRMVSNDIAATLETLLLWYARQTNDELAPEEVLGILLASTDVPLRYPARSVHNLVDHYDISPEDSVGDLLAAVGREGALTVPPTKSAADEEKDSQD